MAIEELESYAESVRAVVIEAGLEVATLSKIKELVLLYRQKRGLMKPDDFELRAGSKSDRRWEHRVRSGLLAMRRSGEAALIARAKYRFFL